MTTQINMDYTDIYISTISTYLAVKSGLGPGGGHGPGQRPRPRHGARHLHLAVTWAGRGQHLHLAPCCGLAWLLVARGHLPGGPEPRQPRQPPHVRGRELQRRHGVSPRHAKHAQYNT